MGPKLNLIYLCDFICEFNSEYIKRRRICITSRWSYYFLIVCLFLDFFMILAKFVFFCQIFSSEGHFWNFEMVGNRQTHKKILKNCRKRHLLKTYLLKYVLKWKMDEIFIIKFCTLLDQKCTDWTVIWTITLREITV